MLISLSVQWKFYEGIPKPKFKDLIFKEFLPADFKDRVTCLKADQRHPAFPYRSTTDLLMMGAFLYHLSMGMREGKVVLSDELKLFIGADLSWGVDLCLSHG